MGSYLLRLSWPAKALWQNRPTHWAARAKAKRTARREATAEALLRGLPSMPGAELSFEFHPPDNRKRDLHNMPATQKAAIDGIADAMRCDDAGFKVVWPTEWGQVVPNGAVSITINGHQEPNPKETIE